MVSEDMRRERWKKEKSKFDYFEFVDDNESVSVEITEFSTTVTPSINLDEELSKDELSLKHYIKQWGPLEEFPPTDFFLISIFCFSRSALIYALCSSKTA